MAGRWHAYKAFVLELAGLFVRTLRYRMAILGHHSGPESAPRGPKRKALVVVQHLTYALEAMLSL
eukprot:12608171-Alexandrium_andersonii.AAC.1